MKYKILKLDEFVGKELGEVKNYLDKNYAGKLATEEDLKNLPDEYKDGNWYFTFGSLVRDSIGHWRVPYAFWDRLEWNRGEYFLDNRWISDSCVILLNDFCPTESLKFEYCKCKRCLKICPICHNFIRINTPLGK